MKTRKLLALLLALVMSLTMGGLTVFADGSGDADAGKDPSITGPTNPDDKSGDPDTSGDPGDSSDTTDRPDVSMSISGIHSAPVKAGDLIHYTVEVEANGADTTGWYVLVHDSLKAEIDRSESPREKVELIDNMASFTYTIPKDFYISSSKYFVDFTLTDGKKDEFGMENILVQVFDRFITAIPTFDTYLEFPTEGLVAGKEYPFTMTWASTVDYVIDDFSTEIWTEIYDKQGDAYEKGLKPTYKITECPEGAKVKQGEGSAKVENIRVPEGGIIKISGTVSYPAEGMSAQLHFNEIINGEFLGQISTTAFSVGPSTGGTGNGNTSQKPGTETSGNTAKDKATGITVSGLDAGVTLSVKSVNKERQTAIEEQVKKLLGNTKGIKIFDISLLKDGKEVEPGTPVKVSIPIPDGFSTNLKLYHQNEKGVLEPVKISVKDSTVSFEAKSFSPYVLVDMGAKAVDPSNGKSPKTGDTSSMILYLMLALAAMGGIGYAAERKMNG